MHVHKKWSHLESGKTQPRNICCKYMYPFCGPERYRKLTWHIAPLDHFQSCDIQAAPEDKMAGQHSSMSSSVFVFSLEHVAARLAVEDTVTHIMLIIKTQICTNIWWNLNRCIGCDCLHPLREGHISWHHIQLHNIWACSRRLHRRCVFYVLSPKAAISAHGK